MIYTYRPVPNLVCSNFGLISKLYFFFHEFFLGFDLNQLLSNFAKEKNNLPRYICDKCPNKSYTTKGNLQRHIEWECGKEPRFKCKFCTYACKYKFNMKQHMYRQHSEKIITKET